MSLEDWSASDEILSCDACFDGFGALFGKQYFHSNFPSFITDDHLHINCLQLWVVIVAVQIWGKKLKGKKLFIFCDNEDSVTVVNSGSTKDSFMQNCLRELCFVKATHEFEVRAKHIAGEENRLADYLSRWHIHSRFRDTFLSLVDLKTYEEVSFQSSDVNFMNDW
jgi:hypothetical protein